VNRENVMSGMMWFNSYTSPHFGRWYGMVWFNSYTPPHLFRPGEASGMVPLRPPAARPSGLLPTGPQPIDATKWWQLDRAPTVMSVSVCGQCH
jgi:hypothetical protein